MKQFLLYFLKCWCYALSSYYIMYKYQLQCRGLTSLVCKHTIVDSGFSRRTVLLLTRQSDLHVDEEKEQKNKTLLEYVSE